ncbi:hypothetical protein HGRIS_003411 [Hohenbuehelia grisea]|uniref:Uncharacterized protein n=1 Tax=Hohenbuehelia grisea TaxID=104357 RepID=A0ABR3JFZ5_9AGAR
MNQCTSMVIKKRRRPPALLDPCFDRHVSAALENDICVQTQDIPANQETILDEHAPGKSPETEQPQNAAAKLYASKDSPLPPIVTIEDFLRRDVQSRKKYRGKSRKRKRVGRSSPDFRTPDRLVTEVSGDLHLDPPATAIPPADSSSSSYLAVDRPRKRKRRIALSGTGSSASYSPGSSQESSASSFSPACNHGQRPRRAVTLARGTKTLRKRLIEAAVMTGAEPVDSLLNPDCADAAEDDMDLSVRRPLRFVPVEAVARSPVPEKRHARRLDVVDPKKRAPFQMSYLGAFARNQPQSPSRRKQRVKQPLTRWRSICNVDADAVDSSTVHRLFRFPSGPSRRRVDQAEFGMRYPPLQFVPLAVAEKVHALGSSDSATRRSNPGSEDSRAPLPFVAAPVEHSMTVTSQPSRTLSPRVSTDKKLTEAPRKALKLVDLPFAPLAPPSGRFDSNPVVLSSNPMSSTESIPPQYASQPQQSDVGAIVADSRPSLNILPTKELKPLPSFLTSFLDILRSAKQAETSKKDQVNNTKRSRPMVARQRHGILIKYHKCCDR